MIILKSCTNCQRSGIKCAYTKRSVKRGPAKGYIKELEKRLDHLETVALPSSSTPGSSTPSSKSTPSNPDPEATEDRIARLENALNDSEKTTRDLQSSSETKDSIPSTTSDSSKPDSVASALPNGNPFLPSESRGVKRIREDSGENLDSSVAQEVISSVVKPSPSPSRTQSHSRNVSSNSNASQRLRVIESASNIKRSYLSTSIQATFPVVYFDPIEAARSVTGLDEKPLLRGMKLLSEPIEKPSPNNSSSQLDARSRSVSRSESPFVFNGASGFASPAVGSNGLKVKSHLSKQLNLFAQASRGFSNESSGSFSSGSSSQSKKGSPVTGALRAGRRLSHMKAGLEADTLLFCYLDTLRRGQENNSALAVAVSKLGGLRSLASDDDSEPATKRRRTVMMMMDRW